MSKTTKSAKSANVASTDIKSINNALSNIKTKVVIAEAPNSDNHYNCWGFTAAALGWVPDLFWMSDDQMESLLKANSRKTSKPKSGDIVVFRDGRQLEHTAIITDLNPSDNHIIHKPGCCYLEVSTEKTCKFDFPHFGDISQYRRPKTKKVCLERVA